MDVICPSCATPLQEEPPAGLPILSVDGSALNPPPGQQVGFRAQYCPLGHAVHLTLHWQEAPILLTPTDYLAELFRAARSFGLQPSNEDELRRKLGLDTASGD
jgi:hypothetical protein